jgi:hypothetical protein
MLTVARTRDDLNRWVLTCYRDDVEIGFARVRLVVGKTAAALTGTTLESLVEFEYLEIYEQYRPAPRAAQLLFCTTFEIIETELRDLPMGGLIVNTIRDPDPYRRHILDRSGLFRRLDPPPFFYFASTEDFSLIRQAHCSDYAHVSRVRT